MARQIRRPSQRGGDAIGRALGVAGTIGSVVAAPFTGGASLLGLPGSLGLAGGGQNVGMNKLASVSDIASAGQSIGNSFGESQPVKAANLPGPEGAELLKRPDAMGRKLANAQPVGPQGDQASLMALQKGEQALNELRKTDPALAQELQGPLFDGIFEASKRMKGNGSLTGGVI